MQSYYHVFNSITTALGRGSVRFLYVTMFEFSENKKSYTIFIVSFRATSSARKKKFKKYTAALVNIKYLSPKILGTIFKKLSILLTLLKPFSEIYTFSKCL